jgi:hypothetical protein
MVKRDYIFPVPTTKPCIYKAFNHVLSFEKAKKAIVGCVTNILLYAVLELEDALTKCENLSDSWPIGERLWKVPKRLTI